MILPRPLYVGSTIGICSPAGPVQEEKLRPAVEAIERSGYRVVLSPSVFGKHGFLSGQDTDRVRDLHELFARPDVDAVFCSRGGSGTSRLLERVDAKLIAASRKPFLGFSDITALQWMLYARTGFVSYSGPLAVEWNGLLSEATLLSCRRVLSGECNGNLFGEFPRETYPRFEILRGGGDVDGTLMPGNLALITTLLGTPYLPDLSQSLLFIEDVSEAPYRLDRMLFHLRNAGVLGIIRGLLVGDFGSSGEEGEFELQRRSVLEATIGSEYPIMIGLPYGHGRHRMTLPVGARVRAGFSGTPSLTWLDGPREVEGAAT